MAQQLIFRFFLPLLLIIASSSCVPVKRIAYVHSDKQTLFHGKPTDIRIRPGDEIYIRIRSADEQSEYLLGDAQRGSHDARLSSYIVNDQGSIRLPYLGIIKIEELTLEEAADKIEKALKDFLFEPVVFMRFMNSTITVLGEVQRPGVYMFDYKNINIFQAIGYAGDITEFGNRRKVLIIRENGELRQKKYVDLTQGKILESSIYTLQSGDIVFVEPLGRKKWGMTTVPYNLILTVISTGLFIYTFIQNNN